MNSKVVGFIVAGKNKILNSILDYFHPNKIISSYNFRLRAYVMFSVFAAILVFILIRYAWLSFFPTHIREMLVDTGAKQFETNITLLPPRARITDRNGRPLATSIPATSLFILTKRMPKDKATLEKVSVQMGIPYAQLISYTKSKKNFIWLKRQMTSNEFNALGSLKRWHDFIGTVDEPRRSYPEKDLSAQLIGFVGSDGNGLEGIEKIYNSRLNSKPIKAQVMRDARGHVVMVTPNEASKPYQQVPDLQLSIDLTIQEITQKALAEGVIRAKAKGGSAIVMDVKTGELLSIASYPAYDLNTPPEDNPEARRFRPVMDAIELGSVVKPMWVAKALDLGVITKKTKIYAEHGEMALAGGSIHDTHPHDIITPEEVLKFSSNIGIYKIVQKIGRDEFYNALMHVGFGRQPGTGLPGEWSGRIQKPKMWREMRFANMAFGQGFAISPLQLIHGLSIIVGGGIDRGVNFLKVDPDIQREEMGPPLKYVSPEISAQVSQMMASVVEEEGGTGALARIPGVLVAGKTGTAQIWSNQDHAYSGRTPVFEGVIPADDPKLAIVIVLDSAGVRPAYGGVLAGPVFAEIGKKTIDYLNARGLYTINYHRNSYLKNTEKTNKEE